MDTVDNVGRVLAEMGEVRLIDKGVWCKRHDNWRRWAKIDIRQQMRIAGLGSAEIQEAFARIEKMPPSADDELAREVAMWKLCRGSVPMQFGDRVVLCGHGRTGPSMSVATFVARAEKLYPGLVRERGAD